MTIDITEIVKRVAETRELTKILEGDEWGSVIKAWEEEMLEIWKPARVPGWHGKLAYPDDIYAWPVTRIYYELAPEDCRNLDDPEKAEIAFDGSDDGDYDTYWFPALYLIDHDRWRSQEEAKVEPYLEARRKKEEQEAAQALANKRAEYERLRAEFEPEAGGSA